MQNSNVVLFISGSNDKRTAKVALDNQGVVQALLSGSTNIFTFMRSNRFDPKQTVVIPSNVANIRVPSPVIIFNEISNPETHHNALLIAAKIVDQFESVPCLNPVERILNTGRDKVFQMIHKLPGVVCPKTVLVIPKDRDDFCSQVKQHFNSADVIIREAGAHGGNTMIRWSLDKPPSLLDIYAIDGRSFYITEYYDFKSADGHYRKFRVAVVDGQPYIRHMIASDSWSIHSGSRDTMYEKYPELKKEEEDYLENFDDNLRPLILETVQAIHKALGLDYFGIDFSMDDNDQMVIFEANANMNILINSMPAPNIFVAPIDKIISAIHTLIHSKLPDKAIQ